MKPLIFSFLTASDNTTAVDESILQYDKDLQLSIVKETKQPAFDHLNLRTMTDTKTANEGCDSDRSLEHSFPTPTVDNMKLTNDLGILLSTKTITLSVEVSDEDHGPKMAKLMLGTMTMTRTNMEASDSDKQ